MGRTPPPCGFKKNDPRTQEIARRAREILAKKRSENVYSYRPVKQLFTEILSRPDETDEQKRSQAITLAEKILALAQGGEQWAAHLIYERIEGRVPNVIRTDSRRRYEELTAEELQQALDERLSRPSLSA